MIKEINIEKIPFVKKVIVLKLYSIALRKKDSYDFRTAILYLRICIFILPEWEDLWINLVEALFDSRRFKEAAKLYYKYISKCPTISTVHQLGFNLSVKSSLIDPFHSQFKELIKINEIKEMLITLSKSKTIYHPSRFWLYHLVFNTIQLEIEGIENFKRTVNKNYYSWSSHKDIKSQIETITNSINTQIDDFNYQFSHNVQNQLPDELTETQWGDYIKLLRLLYIYAKSHDKLNLWDIAEENPFGNPICININGKNISQDLPNSIIEINTFMPHVIENIKKGNLNVIELGAGHGRIGSVLLKMEHNISYTVVDIPPALFVSQKYLKTIFPDKKVFSFREFNDWNEIKDEFNSAEIKFLLPNQVELLPEKTFNIFINISSLHEMRHEQIINWHHQINRLTNGIFFSKQYKYHKNSFDEILVTQDNYPILNNWEPLLNRINPIFSSFFETVYLIK